MNLVGPPEPNASRQPVRPQPPRTMGRPERILVGYDGSSSSLRAARLAISLATAGSGRGWIVHAGEPNSAVAEPLTDEEAAVPIRAIRRSMDSLVAEATSRGLQAESVVREGRPAVVLWQVAHEVGAELVVVGTRGLGGTARSLLGSVSSTLVEHATVPVAVVP
jgi:nucleotide-binding universal stress UspA family protein